MTRPLACLAALLALAPLPARAQQSRPAKAAAPERIHIDYEYRQRMTTLAPGEDEVGRDMGGLVAIDLEQDAKKAERFEVAIEVTPFDGAGISQSGSLIRSKEGWEPEDGPKKEAMRGMATILNLGRRLRELFPEDTDWSRPGKPREVPFEKLSAAIKLQRGFEALTGDTPSALRYVGLRSVDGVPCLALSFSVTRRAPDPNGENDRAGRLSGLVLVERDGGMARLVNFTHKQRTSSLDTQTGERSTRVVATRFRLRLSRGPGKKKP